MEGDREEETSVDIYYLLYIIKLKISTYFYLKNVCQHMDEYQM